MRLEDAPNGLLLVNNVYSMMSSNYLDSYIFKQWNNITNVQDSDGNPIKNTSWTLTDIAGAIDWEVTPVKIVEIEEIEEPILIGDSYEVNFEEDGIRVGCVFIESDTVEDIYQRFYEKRNK